MTLSSEVSSNGGAEAWFLRLANGYRDALLIALLPCDRLACKALVSRRDLESNHHRRAAGARGGNRLATARTTASRVSNEIFCANMTSPGTSGEAGIKHQPATESP